LLSGVEPSKMKMCFGQPLPFELTDTAQSRADKDAEFAWLVEQVYSACAATDPAKRLCASAVAVTLEEHSV
jgi:hypothetical protein